MSGWHLHRHHRGPQFLIDTTNTGWILLSGHQRIPPLGHQWILFHGHGHPCPANSDATAADTSSLAAGSIAAVERAAAALAALIVEPMLDKSDAAEARNSGATAR
jgi:hypothetical protein